MSESVPSRSAAPAGVATGVAEASIELTVNGARRQLTIGVNETLADVLRESLGLTGTKIGCNQGECGACTVLIDGNAIISCLTLAIECEQQDIVTIEGLANPASGELDPVQAAFMEGFGVQCGYCTPGFIMSAAALLRANPDPSVAQVRAAIEGNLCRCTGYTQIVESILDAAARLGRH